MGIEHVSCFSYLICTLGIRVLMDEGYGILYVREWDRAKKDNDNEFL